MAQDEKFSLLSKLKYQYIITDPFPEHSFYESISDLNKKEKSFFKKWFNLGNEHISNPEEISIWKAYRMGQEDVYKRLEAALK